MCPLTLSVLCVLCCFLLGGRGKKGGGFATVSSSYKVRPSRSVLLVSPIARHADPMPLWNSSIDEFKGTNISCVYDSVNRIIFLWKFLVRITCLESEVMTGLLLHSHITWIYDVGWGLKKEICKVNGIGVVLAKLRQCWLIRSDWCSEIPFFSKIWITWPRQPSQNLLLQLFTSLPVFQKKKLLFRIRL